jgi:hypothetical protein
MRASANMRVRMHACADASKLWRILTLAVYVSRQGAVGRGLVLHAARALRKVAAVSCSAPCAGGPKCSRAEQAAAAGSRVLLLVSVCQVVCVSSSSLLCVRSCVSGSSFLCVRSCRAGSVVALPCCSSAEVHGTWAQMA